MSAESSNGNGSTPTPAQHLTAYWANATGRNPNRVKLTGKRKALIRRLIEDGFDIDELELAVDGNQQSAFHQGDNEQHKVYDEFELIFRNAESVERFTGYLREVHAPNAKMINRHSAIDAVFADETLAIGT